MLYKLTLNTSKIVLTTMFICLLFSFETQAAIFTVDNRLDAGGGSLREAVNNANATAEDDVINFNPLFFDQPRTISLITGQIEFDGTGTTVINAPGANLLTISGSDTNRIFLVSSNNSAIISGVTLTDGNEPDEDADGGAIRNFGNLEIINSVITDNFSGEDGGGISSFGNLTVRNSVISNNRAQGEHARGGGIYSFGDLTLINSTISGNYASEDGAGLKLAGNARIENSLISGNDCIDNGGGMEITNNFNESGEKAVIINTTITDNKGFQGGAGIFVVFGSRVEVYSSTIAFNRSGGGIVAFSDTNDTIVMRNTIVAKNPRYSTDPSDKGLDIEGTITSQGYNLIGVTNQTIITGNAAGNILNADPLLAPLADNGGATLTHKLSAGSPAIDAGDPNNFPQFDARGFLRPADGDGNGTILPDIGAFELNANPAQTGNFAGKIVSGNVRTNLTAVAHLIGQNGLKKSASVSPLGYFRFNDLPSDQSYIVYFQTKSGSIASKTISVNTTEGVLEF